MINYKGKFLKADKPELLLFNRGLSFGDGVFETIICSDSEIYHFDYHWERLMEAFKTLHYDLGLKKHELQEEILRTVKTYNPLTLYRVKFILWRAGEGKYQPETNNTDWLISVNEFSGSTYKLITNCAISKNIRLHHSISSSLKTISALPYVIAAQEKKYENQDEILLLDHHGRMAEASAANLFFYDHEKNTFYTPPLESGCINGVIRRKMIANLAKSKYRLEEKFIMPDEIHSGLNLFTTNVAGIHQIITIDGKQLRKEHDLMELFKDIVPYQDFN